MSTKVSYNFIGFESIYGRIITTDEHNTLLNYMGTGTNSFTTIEEAITFLSNALQLIGLSIVDVTWYTDKDGSLNNYLNPVQLLNYSIYGVTTPTQVEYNGSPAYVKLTSSGLTFYNPDNTSYGAEMIISNSSYANYVVNARMILDNDIADTITTSYFQLYYYSNTFRVRYMVSNFSPGTTTATARYNGWVTLYDGYTPIEPEPTDPYSPGGTSGTGGGTGNFDNTSDTIPLPGLPNISASDTGFITLFSPSLAQLKALQDYLWDDVVADIVADPTSVISQSIDALKKIVGNPYEALLGLSIVPVSPSTSASREVKMYGVIKTGISLPVISSQFVEVDCGTLNINEYWGAYLDYSPYTKVTSLYLPYVGVVSLDVDQIMGKALRVVYHVDLLSGCCIAYILVDGSVEFHYQGHCVTNIPITSADFTSTITSAMGLVGSITNIASSGISGFAAGGVGGALMGVASSAISQAPSMVNNVMNSKPDIKSGSGIGSSGGLMSVQKPFLIIERPRQAVAENQNHFTGYPTYVKNTVGNLSGYTEFEYINLTGISLTKSELNELEEIMKGGVYL